jgi:hypothetical protein
MSRKSTVEPTTKAGKASHQDWLNAVNSLTGQIATWAEEEGWWVHRDTKEMHESPHGRYQVPTLMIQAPRGRLVLDPIGGDLVGGGGRVDLCVFPTYDYVMAIWDDKNWRLKGMDGWDFDRALSKRAFMEAATRLFAAV